MSVEGEEVTIRGKKLTCPICKNKKFLGRRTQLNTRGLTFLKIDWLNKSAQNYICDDCGYVFWFVNDWEDDEHWEKKK